MARSSPGPTRFYRPSSGFTIAELLVSIGIFGLVMAICVVALSQANLIFLNSTGRDSALHELAKAHAALVADLELTRASAATFQQVPVPPSQGAGYDGDSINFLTPVYSTTSQAAYGADGSAFWMRNINYYLIVPQNHNSLFSWTCAGAADIYGYDDACPHKILVRQVTDQNSSTPAIPSSVQSLLAPFGPFPRPTGFPRGATLNTVAINLLTFRCTQPTQGQIKIDLRALSFNDAYKSISIGSTPLTPTTYVFEQTFSVFPQN